MKAATRLWYGRRLEICETKFISHVCIATMHSINVRGASSIHLVYLRRHQSVDMSPWNTFFRSKHHFAVARDARVGTVEFYSKSIGSVWPINRVLCMNYYSSVHRCTLSRKMTNFASNTEECTKEEPKRWIPIKMEWNTQNQSHKRRYIWCEIHGLSRARTKCHWTYSAYFYSLILLFLESPQLAIRTYFSPLLSLFLLCLILFLHLLRVRLRAQHRWRRHISVSWFRHRIKVVCARRILIGSNDLRH